MTQNQAGAPCPRITINTTLEALALADFALPLPDDVIDAAMYELQFFVPVEGTITETRTRVSAAMLQQAAAPKQYIAASVLQSIRRLADATPKA